MAEFKKVAKTSDIPPGEIRSFEVEGEIIAICNVGGRFYAIKDECTHMNYPLSDGFLDEETITCAWHGAKFNVRTGEVLSMPAYESVETYQLKVEGNDIYILIEVY
ncbi:MAG: biphenyl 2,3-dioxygenase [Candidatus Dadabacteria bacterium]